MAKMSSLSQDLVAEILSLVPMTSLRRIRLTCKKWNTLSKDGNFTKKHLAQAASTAKEGEFLAILMMNCSLYLMRINLHNEFDDPPSCISLSGKLINLDDSDPVVVSRVCYCDGLLLCTTEAYTKLVVWNPYLGQARCVCFEGKSVPYRKLWYNHALGYKKGESCRSYKILRFAAFHPGRYVHEIYEFYSDSWRVLDITPDWDVDYENYGLSLKGNTYWYAGSFLLCFDFTTEGFAPRLPLPFTPFYDGAATLSSVRDEQLAVMFQSEYTFEMDIWVTTKIEPNAVSWSKFLSVDMRPLTGFRFYTGGSFLIDEEKTAVVVFDEDTKEKRPNRNIAYIIGENGYYREVDLGKITSGKEGFPHACFYAPSLVQINQPA